MITQLFKRWLELDALQKSSQNKSLQNLITRCLGHEERVEVDHTPVELRPQDWVVLCSDGLPTVLRDEQISDVITAGEDPDDVCEELVKQTIDGGAPDNVTVVVIEYLDEGKNGDNK